MINKKFIDDIKNNYPNISDNINIHITKNNKIPLDFLLHNFKDGFVFPQITKYINKCKKYIIINFFNINLHIIYKNDNEINISSLLKTIKRCYTLSKIYKLSKIFNIYILMSPYKRFIPNTGIIKPVHINGGFTYTNSNEIFISRKEEYSKVILHEMIHHITNINNDNWDIDNINKLKKHFNISNKTKLIPNEAVVELWASIYNILFISFEYKIPYKILLYKELECTLNQSYKLKLFQKNKEWVENTNAYCYVIFKTILLYNFKKLMKTYKYPYDIDAITSFLIKNSTLPVIKKNISKYRNNNSLCMMLFSDY